MSNDESRPEAAPESATKTTSTNVAQSADKESAFVEHLDEVGVPLFVANRADDGREFCHPPGWSSFTSDGNAARLAKRRPGDAVCAVVGDPFAVLDVDTRNGGDVEAVRLLLGVLGIRIYAEESTPGGGAHFWVAGDPDLPTVHATAGRDGLRGMPGVELLCHGAMVYLPGTQRPKYGGRGYDIVSDNLLAVADGGDPGGTEALLDCVATHRVAGQGGGFEPSPPWDGAPPDARQAAYLAAALENSAGELEKMQPRSGRNAALYRTALKLGSFVSGAGLPEQRVIDRLTEASAVNGLVRDDGARSVAATIRSGLTNGRRNPRAVPEPAEPDQSLTSGQGSDAGDGAGASSDLGQARRRPGTEADLANARHLVASHGGKLRYVVLWKRRSVCASARA